jgi:hypothetical protein
MLWTWIQIVSGRVLAFNENHSDDLEEGHLDPRKRLDRDNGSADKIMNIPSVYCQITSVRFGQVAQVLGLFAGVLLRGSGSSIGSSVALAVRQRKKVERNVADQQAHQVIGYSFHVLWSL